MSDTLILQPHGNDGCNPDQEPWEPGSGHAVEIHNESGADQTLSDISPGCLTEVGGGTVTSISIAKDGKWVGRAGSTRGYYTYNDGEPERGLRRGTIDPS